MRIYLKRLGQAWLPALLLIAGCGGGGGGSGQAGNPAARYTVSGIVSVPPSMIVDGDVNDPYAPYRSNDSFALAQPLPNPGAVGGYVNNPGTGPEGRSFDSGDTSDFFIVDLLEGQQIALFQGSAPVGSPAPDLDLLLYDEDRQLVDASLGNGAAEALIVPASGRYYIEVFAAAGASTYVLTVGQTLSAAEELAGPAMRLSGDFASGEAVVRWHDGPAGASTARRAALKRAGMRDHSANMRRETLEQLAPSAARRAAALARLEKKGRAGGAAADLGQLSRLETLLAIKALAADGAVEAVEPNYLRRPALLPNDRFYPLQWHYQMINLPAAWDLSTGSRDVVVAVIDSGVLPGHPDLQGQLIGGFDFISDPARSLDGDGIDPDPTDPGDGSPGGSSFHGTHVAGTIGAATHNQTGVAGVAWDVSLMPLRVLGRDGEGTSADIREAIRYAAGMPNASGQLPARPADVINLSLGGSSFSSLDQQLFNEVRARGVIVVAAAGNQGSSAKFYPAAYSGVIGVSAVQIDQTLAPYSSFGAHVEVAAPGGGFTDLNGDGYVDGVLSTAGNDSGPALRHTYAFAQGTSMAAPHVSGVVALMKAVNPALTPAQLDQLLASGQLTLPPGGPVPHAQFGYGLIDARRAVEAAQSGSGLPLPPLLSVNPAALSFGITLDALPVTLANVGGGVLQITEISIDQPWLSVIPESVDQAGLGSYFITVNRNGLAPGVYAGTVAIRSTANERALPVLLQVADNVVPGDVGRLYVLLIDGGSGETVAQVELDSATGDYPFEFRNLEPGEYRIVGGTDLNNDGLICDPGEACGAYLTLDAPKLLNVNRNRSKMDFVVSFGATISGSASLEVHPAR